MISKVRIKPTKWALSRSGPADDNMDPWLNMKYSLRKQPDKDNRKNFNPVFIYFVNTEIIVVSILAKNFFFVVRRPRVVTGPE